MVWQCKLCAVSFTSRIQLFKHYRLQHSQFARVSPLPCLYTDCMCTFQTLNALSTHLSRYHTAQLSSRPEQSLSPVVIKCLLCAFREPFSESIFLSHLRKHLKNNETVTCPYKDCSYSTNVYSSFNCHKNRVHQLSLASDFKAVVVEDPQDRISEVTSDLHEECPGQSIEVAAASPQPMILRVVETDGARKLKLSSRPASVDALIKIIKEQLELDLDFRLLYEDPDFDGKLTSLDDIKELPQKAVVHISLSLDSSSLAILSDVSSPERLSRWPPGPFPVPTFAFDVELKLRDGNNEFEKNNRRLKLTRDLKHDILEKLASTIYGFKAYPSDKEIAVASEALVAKHPCLKEAGSETGWNGWKNSIKFKMGNFRNQLRRAGCQEVTVNAGKRGRSNPYGEPSHSNIKRPKRAEVNFLPNFPQGEDPSSLEQLRQTIAEEVKKTEKNLPLIRKMMQTTFALRRQTIVKSSPPVNELMDLWPALKIESEVYAEFQLITNQNLPNTFYAELDRHLPRLMKLFRQKASKTGNTADALADILKIHDEQEIHDIHTRRTTVLHALPVYLREEVSGFFRTCTDEPDEPELEGVSVALLTVISDHDTSPVHYQPVKISVVIESDIMISLPRFGDSFLVMFGLIYALQLNYPKALTNTFEFIQKILLGLEAGKLSPRLQTLKNDLMIHV